MVKVALIVFLLLSNSVNAFTGVDIDGDKFEYKNNMMFSKKPIVKAWVGDIFGGHHIHTFISHIVETKHGNIPNKHSLRVHIPNRRSNSIGRDSIRIASSNQVHRDSVRNPKRSKRTSGSRS
jgi:hypothetical protein